MHYVIVFVSNGDSTIAMEILIRLCFGHGKAAGKCSDECYDIFCDVFDAIHILSYMGQNGAILPLFTLYLRTKLTKILHIIRNMRE